MTDSAPLLDSPASPTYTLRQSVSAFVDLLGLSNALQALDQIPLQDLPKESSTPLVQQSIGAIILFRKLFAQHFEVFSTRVPMGDDAPPELHALWDRSYDYDLRLSSFSDCVLVTLFIDRDNIFATMRGLIALLASLTSTAVHMFAGGQLVRGAIETGVAIDSGDSEVLGSGIAHAYQIEKDVAVYPRICAGPRLMGFLTFLADPRNSSALKITPQQHLLLRRQVEMVRSMLISDPDGAPRLDYVSDMMREAGSLQGEKNLLTLAKEVAAKTLSGIDSEKNLRHAVKWHWLVGALGSPQRPTSDD